MDLEETSIQQRTTQVREYRIVMAYVGFEQIQNVGVVQAFELPYNIRAGVREIFAPYRFVKKKCQRTCQEVCVSALRLLA